MAKQKDEKPLSPQEVATIAAEPEKTSLAPVAPVAGNVMFKRDSGLIVADEGLLNDNFGRQGMWTFDLKTADGILRAEAHDCDRTDNAADFINQELKIAYFSCGRAQFMNEDTGEMQETKRICIELTNGKLVNLFSEPAWRQLKSRYATHVFLSGKPLGPDNPLTLVLKRVPTKTHGRSMYSLDRPK